MQLTTDSHEQSQTAASFPNNRGQYLIESMGLAAAQELSFDQHCQILAVFDRCFYVKTATGLLCVGLAELGRGPLNVLLGSEHRCLPFDLFAGHDVHIFNRQIILEDGRLFDSANACCYRGKERLEPLALEPMLRNRNTLRLLRGKPEEGFSWLLSNDTAVEDQSVLQAALRQTTAASLRCLKNWLCDSFDCTQIDNDAPTDSLDLVGAGPGLTPSGDDLIAGVMLALLRLQRTDLVNSLWGVLEPSLKQLTNPISAAHLEQAAKGGCSEAMDDLLYSIFQGQDVDGPTLVATLDSMGCTSGWDTLGGAVMVIDAWHHSLITTHRTVLHVEHHTRL